MATTIASVINGIALNIFSCVVYDKGKVFLAHLEKEQIKERIYSWTEKFFSTHSEMVFESSQFYDYITYQKPFDKICRYVGSLTVEYKKKCLKALKKGFFFVKYFVFMYVILCHCVL